MHKRKIAAVTMAVIISNFSSNTVSVLAHELNTKSLVQSASNQKSDLSEIKRLNKVVGICLACLGIITILIKLI